MKAYKPDPYNNPPAEMLCNALNGSSIAIEFLLRFYDPYINKLSTMYVYDSNDEFVRHYVDEDRKQILNIAFKRGVRNFAKLLK